MVFVLSRLQNDKLFAGLIMIDLQKAFDSVTYSILLQNLEHYGFCGNAFNLFFLIFQIDNNM